MAHLAQAVSIGHDVAAQGLGIGLMVILIGVALFHVIFFLAALFSILGANIGCGGKILWVFVIFFLPFLGSLLWFVAGRPRPGRYYS